MGSLFDAVVCWIRWAVLELLSGILGLLNAIANAFVTAANAALDILPDDPAAVETGGMSSKVLGALNYFLPISMVVEGFLMIFGIWVIYRTIQGILAFLRLDF